MKWRIIVRMKLNGDSKSKLGNRIKGHLKKCGISYTSETDTWEGTTVNAEEAAEQFRQIFDDLGKVPPFDRRRLGQLWIYIDRARNG
jgi:hypothetical protein